jgi:hypothetical protein
MSEDAIDVDLSTEPACETPSSTRQHPQNRRTCDEPGCATVLSRYNDYDYCSLHQPMVVPRMRGKII